VTDPRGGRPTTGASASGPAPDLPPPPPAAASPAFVAYLGPDPALSKPFGTAFKIGAGLVALVSAALAVQYWLRRNLWLGDPEVVMSNASNGRLDANAALTGQLIAVRHVLVPIAVLMGVLWWVRRRMPPPACSGPSHVERPLLRSVPAWLWVLPPLLLVLGGVLTGSANAGLSEPTWRFVDVIHLNAHKAELNTLASLGSLARAVAWTMLLTVPIQAERSHRARVERSRSQRTTAKPF